MTAENAIERLMKTNIKCNMGDKDFLSHQQSSPIIVEGDLGISYELNDVFYK